MRISDWSSDVCSSDLQIAAGSEIRSPARRSTTDVISKTCSRVARATKPGRLSSAYGITGNLSGVRTGSSAVATKGEVLMTATPQQRMEHAKSNPSAWRSEEHTSELQSLMRNSYAVFCLKTKN